MFTDGDDLRTPELVAAVDRVAAGFRGPDGEPFDFGRFDLRHETDDALRRGDFAVVELNGVTSEATNLYDPARSTRWAYGVLFKQWSWLYRLGAARRNAGTKPMSMTALTRTLWQHRKDETRVAD